MEDDNSMSERILRTLETILKTDPELKEFSIIPAESNTKNKSPVLYEEHNIGLESWCVKHIYRYAYLELFEVRRLLAKKKLSFCKEHNLNHLLIGVLLINPDVSTFWNMKRELVESEVLGVADELVFAKMVLSHKSKSNEAFAYRRWLISRTLHKIPESEILRVLENELAVCELAALRNSNNYHAWTHRIWSMETLASRVANYSDAISNELEFSHQWMSEHVSEHTSFHYRQYLFNSVFKSRSIGNIYEYYYDNVVKIFQLVNENDTSEILAFLFGKEKFHEQSSNYINYICLLLFDLYNTVELLNEIYPSHESIWYYRRYLLYQLVKTSYEYHDLKFRTDREVGEVPLCGTNIVTLSSGFSDGEKQPKLLKCQPNKVESCVLYRHLIKNEVDFIKRSSAKADFHEVELARRHEKWLKFVVCFEEV